MKVSKSLFTGSKELLILGLISEQDMYGYMIIENLRERSNNIFELKAGTLYPILHKLEKDDFLTSYESIADSGKSRKYYKITKKGMKELTVKKEEWNTYTSSVKDVLAGGVSYEPV